MNDINNFSLPNVNEMEFKGKYKDRLQYSLPKAGMPHLKRIINNQVFLEETDPYVYDQRRNQYAMDAAQEILSPTGAPDLGDFNTTRPYGRLPALGPQGET